MGLSCDSLLLIVFGLLPFGPRKIRFLNLHTRPPQDAMLTAPLFAAAALVAPAYPSSGQPAISLFVLSSESRTPAYLLCLDSLAGLIARASPRLYRVADSNWATGTSDSYALWLRELRRDVPVNESMMMASVQAVVTRFASEVKGFILAEGSTTCVALSSAEQLGSLAPERACAPAGRRRPPFKVT